jgi:hypothetical protein
LIGRFDARRSEIVAERESDDEAGIALQTVIRDFTHVSLENEIRTHATQTHVQGKASKRAAAISSPRLPHHPYSPVSNRRRESSTLEAGWTKTSGLAGKKDTTQTRTTQK